MITYTRNLTEGNDFPFITEYAGFDTDTYYVNLQWNLENLFVNTYERDPISVNAYEVDGDLVIVGDFLQPFDHFHLSRAMDFNTYVMPNGQLLIEYYEKHIVDINDYLDQVDNNNKEGFVSRRNSDNLIDPLSLKVNWNYDKMYVGVRFYDENGDPVIASAGTIELSGVAAAGGVQYTLEGSPLTATMPSPVVPVDVPLESLTATPSGLDGVTSWQLIVWQN